MTVYAVAASSGFINEMQFVCSGDHFTTKFVQCVQIVGNGAVNPGLVVAPMIGDGNGDRFFVDIHSNKFYSVHDLPPLVMALC